LEQSGIGDAATDSANYVLLLQALRAEMNRQSGIDGHTYYLSIAAPAGDGNIAKLNPKAISDVVDWINLMAYDFHGGWDGTTGFNAPMVNVDPNPSSAKWSVSASVQGYLVGNPGQGGVPASKLVLGVPFYGRGWDNVQPGVSGNGLGQAGSEATSPGLGETEFPYNNLLSSGVLTYSNGVFAGGAGYTRHWNAQAQVPFLYSPTAKRFITYDDAESMRVKAAYTNQQGLGGMMFWEASEDVTTPGASLSDAVYEGMRLP
jgi:chitinase